MNPTFLLQGLRKRVRVMVAEGDVLGELVLSFGEFLELLLSQFLLLLGEFGLRNGLDNTCVERYAATANCGGQSKNGN